MTPAVRDFDEALKGGSAMNISFKRMFVMTALAGIVMSLYAGIASAATQHTTAPVTTQARGQCGGPSLNHKQLIANLDKMGATGSASKFFGVQPLNENLATRVNTTFGVATLARDATIQNEGCSGGALFGAGPKHLSAGTKVWIDMTSLKAKFPNGFSLAPKGKGWKRVVVAVQFRAQTTCTNPGKATVLVFVWVKVKAVVPTAPTVPKTQSPQEFCVTNLKGSWNSDTNTCSIQQGNCSQAVIIIGNNNNVTQGPITCTTPPAPCNCTPSVPPVVVPPIVIPPPVVVPPTPTMDVKNVTSPEEVNNDGEIYPNLYADAYTPNGDSITCVIGVTNPNDHTQSGLGSIVGQRSFTFTSHGYDRVGPYSYQAPTDSTTVGLNDQLEVTCHDNTNKSVKDASGFSRPFPIIATKPSP
jgi:hypothetical protein